MLDLTKLIPESNQYDITSMVTIWEKFTKMVTTNLAGKIGVQWSDVSFKQYYTQGSSVITDRGDLQIQTPIATY